MKKIIILLLFTTLSFSCSSDEDSNSTPEFYNVKYEIVGSGTAYSIRYTSNEGSIEEDNVALPYTKEIRYKTEVNGDNNTYGKKSIIFWVYRVESLADIQEIRLYINNELVDTDMSAPVSSNYSVHFDYIRRD